MSSGIDNGESSPHPAHYFSLSLVSFHINSLERPVNTAVAVLGFSSSALGRFNVNAAKVNACLGTYLVVTVGTNLLATGARISLYVVVSHLSLYRVLTHVYAALVIAPILFPRRPVREYRPEGSRLRAVKWRVMESILQSAAVFTLSSVAFMVTFFTSALAYSLCHSIFQPVVVSLTHSIFLYC